MKRIISFVCFLTFSLFLFVSDCFADVTENELNNNFSDESRSNDIKNTNNDNNDIPNESNKDIFVDEQAFPFVAGLGKNAAH